MFNAFSMIADMESDTNTSNNTLPTYVFDSNGNINLEETIPEYKALMNALKSGISWYDIIYPNGETHKQNASDIPYVENDWTAVSSKSKTTKNRKHERKHSILSDKSDYPNKRPRYS